MFRIAAVSASALALSVAAAAAATGVVLTDDRTLVMFDTETLEVTGSMEVEGVDRLLGIDLRPADNTLVGVADDMRIVTIDPATGAATDLSMMDTALEVGDMPVIVDFNPMADRLRLMTGSTNHRVNVDTGEVTVDGSLNWTPEDENSEAVPMIAAAAYINSYGTPEATAMYNIDAGLGALLQQTAPNDGTLATIGMLTIEDAGEAMAFDVQTDAEGMNMAWLITNNTLHSVDLDTGAATAAGEITGIDGEIRDLTVMPAM
ncbi:DUF4394 domain-containing protein [Paracoccus gahaiensis]|uniref:DUF4394 domain-containing protein n=1 Tax=Paracoccus gahaiensis TaxID=1706839 RepID=A0A4U0RC25_9RHOB|nr:DUF4394 domain-containing protein [Paracoccus gahaiensis]TJZ92052.1 DUF4394 domain-containing protein [Paracoccus gahaiensis]